MLSPTYSLILLQYALPCKACHSRFTLICRLCAYRANRPAPSFSLLSVRQFYCCAVCILFFISTFGVPFSTDRKRINFRIFFKFLPVRFIFFILQRIKVSVSAVLVIIRLYQADWNVLNSGQRFAYNSSSDQKE